MLEIFLGVIIIVLLYVIYNQSQKLNTYENLLEKAEETHISQLNAIVKWMSVALDKLHNIDRLQIFEADDDVGWFFKTLKFQITELNNQIAQIMEEGSSEEEKEEEK